MDSGLPNTMKTFDQISEEVAKEKGYDNFNHFDQTFPKSSKEIFKEIAKRYAEQALDEAAENAQLKVKRIAGNNRYSIDKQSILSIKEKL